MDRLKEYRIALHTAFPYGYSMRGGNKLRLAAMASRFQAMSEEEYRATLAEDVAFMAKGKAYRDRQVAEFNAHAESLRAAWWAEELAKVDPCHEEALRDDALRSESLAVRLNLGRMPVHIPSSSPVAACLRDVIARAARVIPPTQRGRARDGFTLPKRHTRGAVREWIGTRLAAQGVA